MKRIFLLALIIFPLLLSECKAQNPGDPSVKPATGSNVVLLTDATFKTMIFNYEVNTEWKFEGEKPAIIDFYADWCAPCRQLSPLIEEIAKEYSGKINVYKVDTEKEKMLAQKLGITALPTLLFVPSTGKPQVSMGALPKESLIKAVNEVLMVK